MMLGQSHNQGFLIRKVLVQGADTHTRQFRYPIGGELGIALFGQNVSCCRQDRLNGRLRSLIQAAEGITNVVAIVRAIT
jgi:hypothetical protein